MSPAKISLSLAAPVSGPATWEVPVVVLDVVGEADDVLDTTALCTAIVEQCLRQQMLMVLRSGDRSARDCAASYDISVMTAV